MWKKEKFGGWRGNAPGSRTKDTHPRAVELYGGMSVSARGFPVRKWEEGDPGGPRDTVLSAGETEAEKGRLEKELNN